MNSRSEMNHATRFPHTKSESPDGAGGSAMTDPKRVLVCPLCHTEMSAEALFAHQAERDAMDALIRSVVPSGLQVLRYLTLFAPAKTALSNKRKGRLIGELLPDMHREAIAHKGREWAAPPAHWDAAFDQMHQQQVDGTFKALPLTSHGYLYSILAGLAGNAEAVAERQQERDRRTTARQDTVQVRGVAMSIGAGLDALYGGRDPALARFDDAGKRAAPVPPSARQLLKRLRDEKA